MWNIEEYLLQMYNFPSFIVFKCPVIKIIRVGISLVGYVLAATPAGNIYQTDLNFGMHFKYSVLLQMVFIE